MVSLKKILIIHVMILAQHSFGALPNTPNTPIVHQFSIEIQPQAKGNDNTPLMDAASKNCWRTLYKLLKAGTDIDQRNSKGETALMLAAANGHFNSAQILLEWRANPNISNKQGETALMCASKQGFTSTVKTLLNFDVRQDTKNNFGLTALMLATINRHPETVQALLAGGAQLDVPNDNGETALMLASKNGIISVVPILLDAGAEVSTKNKNHETALTLASNNGNYKVVEALLSKQADPEMQNKEGETPLMIASKKGFADVVKILLHAQINKKNGKNIDKKNYNGETSLMLASKNGHAGVVDILLKAGAKIDETNREGESALRLSTTHHKPSVMNVLLEAGANVDQFNKGGSTALMFASWTANPVLADILTQFNSNTNLADTQKGRTALHWALRMCEGSVKKKRVLNRVANVKAVVDILLNHGASPLIKDNRGIDALHWAKSINQQDLYKELRLWVENKGQRRNSRRPAPLQATLVTLADQENLKHNPSTYGSASWREALTGIKSAPALCLPPSQEIIQNLKDSDSQADAATEGENIELQPEEPLTPVAFLAAGAEINQAPALCLPPSQGSTSNSNASNAGLLPTPQSSNLNNFFADLSAKFELWVEKSCTFIPKAQSAQSLPLPSATE